MKRIKTSLEKYQLASWDVERAKQEMWDNHQTLVINLRDDRLNGWDREYIKQLAKKLYK